jgi:hypothetical protein
MDHSGMATVAVALGLVIASPVAAAGCKEQLAEIDEQIANAGPEKAPLMTAIQSMRDQAAKQCEAGNETSASAGFKSIAMLLGIEAPTSAPEPEEPPEPEPVSLENAHTVYISEEGEGILRYTVTDDVEGAQYSLVTGALTGDPRRPIETMGSDGAIYTGPDIAVYVWGITGRHIPIDKLVLTLYERQAGRNVAHFTFEVDDSRAEPKENCGEVDPRTMECSDKRPPGS